MRFTSIPSKLSAILLGLVASTGIALANHADVDFKNEAPPCPCPPTLMDGFYVGANAGYNILFTHASFNSPELALNGNPHIAVDGWNGGLFLGYGKYVTDIFYIGGEVFGYWSSASEGFRITQPGPAGGFVSANIEANGSWGLALIPGLKINQTTLAYLRGGYVWSNVHGNGHVHFNTPTLVNGVLVTDLRSSGNSNVSGWQIGVGAETLLVDNWSLRTDYTYIDYNSSSSNHGVHRIVRDFNPRDNIFSLAIVYHFMI